MNPRERGRPAHPFSGRQFTSFRVNDADGRIVKHSADDWRRKALFYMTEDDQTKGFTARERERLDDVQGSISMSLADLLMAIGRECAPLFKEPIRSIEHGDLPYGEDGLPR